jgi:hypothetical protein
MESDTRLALQKALNKEHLFTELTRVSQMIISNRGGLSLAGCVALHSQEVGSLKKKVESSHDQEIKSLKQENTMICKKYSIVRQSSLMMVLNHTAICSALRAL